MKATAEQRSKLVRHIAEAIRLVNEAVGVADMTGARTLSLFNAQTALLSARDLAREDCEGSEPLREEPPNPVVRKLETRADRARNSLAQFAETLLESARDGSAIGVVCVVLQPCDDAARGFSMAIEIVGRVDSVEALGLLELAKQDVLRRGFVAESDIG